MNERYSALAPHVYTTENRAYLAADVTSCMMSEFGRVDDLDPRVFSYEYQSVEGRMEPVGRSGKDILDITDPHWGNTVAEQKISRQIYTSVESLKERFFSEADGSYLLWVSPADHAADLTESRLTLGQVRIHNCERQLECWGIAVKEDVDWRELAGLDTCLGDTRLIREKIFRIENWDLFHRSIPELSSIWEWIRSGAQERYQQQVTHAVEERLRLFSSGSIDTRFLSQLTSGINRDLDLGINFYQQTGCGATPQMVLQVGYGNRELGFGSQIVSNWQLAVGSWQERISDSFLGLREYIAGLASKFRDRKVDGKPLFALISGEWKKYFRSCPKCSCTVGYRGADNPTCPGCLEAIPDGAWAC